MNANQRLLVLGAAVVLIAAIGGALVYSIGQIPSTTDARLKVVATFYPLAYMGERIGGEDVQVQTLIPANVELHAVDLSPADIAAVQQADVFIYNGADLEPWVEDDLLPALNIESIIIVEATLDAEDYLIELNEGAFHNGGQFDPHTWIDPFLARIEAKAILEAFKEADPANAQAYDIRAEALLTRLQEIEQAYDSGLSNTSVAAIIVAHDAFSYLGHRYGFDVIGVLGLTAEELPSPADLVGIVDRVLEEEIYTLYVTPIFPDDYIHALKGTLEQETGATFVVLTLYVLTGPVGGKDYLQQMEANLESLKVGLGV